MRTWKWKEQNWQIGNVWSYTEIADVFWICDDENYWIYYISNVHRKICCMWLYIIFLRINFSCAHTYIFDAWNNYICIGKFNDSFLFVACTWIHILCMKQLHMYWWIQRIFFWRMISFLAQFKIKIL